MRDGNRDVERDVAVVLRRLFDEPGYASRVRADPVSALGGYALTTGDLEQIERSLHGPPAPVPTVTEVLTGAPRREPGGNQRAHRDTATPDHTGAPTRPTRENP